MQDFLLQFTNSALVVALVFLILRRQDKRMDDQDTRIGDAMRKVDSQPSKEYCIMQHSVVQDRFHTGDEKFEKLEGKIGELQKCMSNVDTNVALLLDRDAREHEE